MLNIEKFGKKFVRYSIKNCGLDACYSLRELAGMKYCPKKKSDEKTNITACDCDKCADFVLDWLFSEYEPDLLENGDGLKPGDWIMVSNDKQGWKNRQFLYFWQGCFYAANLSTSPEQGEAVKWNYARLPEEGE